MFSWSQVVSKLLSQTRADLVPIIATVEWATSSDFQKYGFIRKIKPFHLKMKHNINQMIATAGLTVLHSIEPILQYIFDCSGKGQ